MSRRPKKNLRKKKPTRGLFRFSSTRRSKEMNMRAREKPVLKPSDLRKRKLIKKRNLLLGKVFIIFFSFFCIVLLFWFGLHAEWLTIQKIDVRNKGEISSEKIETFIFDTLKDTPSALFPQTNIFFAPTGSLEKSLTEKFIRIKHVDILRKGLKELIVVVEERSPAIIFCENTTLQKNEHYSGDCFFASNDGTIYSIAPYMPRSGLETIYFAPPEDGEVLGTMPLTEREIQALHTLSETLESKDILVTKIRLVDSETIELDTDKTYSLLVPIKDDYTDELERFFSALGADIFKEERPLKDVYQFDLRFGRKVFYKYNE